MMEVDGVKFRIHLCNYYLWIMNNEQIYSIVGQGLDIATQKGVFNLSDAKVIADALIELKKVLTIQEPIIEDDK